MGQHCDNHWTELSLGECQGLMGIGMSGASSQPGFWPRRSRGYFLVPAAVRVKSATMDASGQEQDLALMKAIAQGERSALSQLYDRYSSLLMAIAVRMLKSQQRAEDLLHDVFLEAWRQAKGYDPNRGSVRAWLCMRMRSRALDRLRADGRAKVVLSDSENTTTAEEASIEPAQEQSFDRQAVRKALATLAPEQQKVLELGYFGGLSSSEIARELNLPLGTVKSRVARALHLLRAYFHEGSRRHES